MNDESVVTEDILPDFVAHNGDGGAREYLLTDQAIQAIVTSWNSTVYNPPGTDVTGWLGRIRGLCEAYGVPLTQRALCAMRYVRVDCQEAARTARCHDMTWDQFATWLTQYDGACYFEDSAPRAETFNRRK
jgi:hypothetical protein